MSLYIYCCLYTYQLELLIKTKMFFNSTFLFACYSATSLRFNSRIESPIDLRSTNSNFMHSNGSKVSLKILLNKKLKRKKWIQIIRPSPQIVWNKGGIVMRGAAQTVIIFILKSDTYFDVVMTLTSRMKI